MATIGEQLATKLNALPGTRWLFNQRAFIVFLIALGLSPTLMWVNDYLLVWGKVWPLSYQWLSALCDSLLAAGIGLMAWQAKVIDWGNVPKVVRRLLKGGWFHLTVLALWASFSIGHMFQESGSVNSWERRTGPNGLYHNVFLVPFLGYVYTLLLIVVISLFFNADHYASQRLLLHAATVLAIGAGLVWLWAGSSFDATHQNAPNGVSKHYYSNPPDPWCGGVITVHICGPAHR